MESPRLPTSGTLFCSSPRFDASQGPANEVAELVHEARTVKTLNPAIATMLQDPNKRKDFFDHMARHVQLIRSRSQAFEDAHVTVYDKTLLILTDNGNDLDHPPAIEYYCDEFLGISNIADQVLATRMLAHSIRVPHHLNQEAWRPTPDPQPAHGSCESDALSQYRPSTSTQATRDGSLYQASILPEMDPQTERLWSLYEKARSDFQAALPNDASQVIAEAARFLRDTAENTIQVMKTKNFDPVMMAELHAVSDLAKATAVSATGGKKRKFDAYTRREEPRELFREDNRPSWQGERNGPYSKDAVYRQERYRPYPDSRDPGRDRYDRYASARGRMNGGRGPRIGRGPTGIPYGYSHSRPVDSYIPNRP